MWKKLCGALLTLTMLLALLPCRAEAVQLSAAAAILMDADSGEILFEKDAGRCMRIASTTKIMTALVALERAKLTDTITVTASHMVEGSSMYLKPGETVEELLYGLMLCSGNDAALALADCCGGLDAFVQAMNEKAAALGMKDTSFANPNGRALRLKTLGNAVCPPQAYPIFHYIAAIETGACAGICPYGKAGDDG